MDFRHLSDGIQLHAHQLDEALVPSSRSAAPSPHSMIDTGSNAAGNGGGGYFFGSLVNDVVHTGLKADSVCCHTISAACHGSREL